MFCFLFCTYRASFPERKRGNGGGWLHLVSLCVPSCVSAGALVVWAWWPGMGALPVFVCVFSCVSSYVSSWKSQIPHFGVSFLQMKEGLYQHKPQRVKERKTERTNENAT